MGIGRYIKFLFTLTKKKKLVVTRPRQGSVELTTLVVGCKDHGIASLFRPEAKVTIRLDLTTHPFFISGI